MAKEMKLSRDNFRLFAKKMVQQYQVRGQWGEAVVWKQVCGYYEDMLSSLGECGEDGRRDDSRQVSPVDDNNETRR